MAIDSDSDNEDDEDLSIDQSKEGLQNMGIRSLNKREILSQKIITTIQYFDEKLIKIDDFIKENKPSATDDYTHDIIFSKLRFSISIVLFKMPIIDIYIIMNYH